MCACVFGCVGVRAFVWVCIRVCACVCVYVGVLVWIFFCAKVSRYERERERESVCVCVFECVISCVYIGMCVRVLHFMFVLPERLDARYRQLPP